MNKEINEALKHIKIRCHPKVVWDDPIDLDLEILEQALLKAQENEKVLNELIKLINNLEPTFNHKGLFNDTDIAGTIIKYYFYGNISASLKRLFKETKERKEVK